MHVGSVAKIVNVFSVGMQRTCTTTVQSEIEDEYNEDYILRMCTVLPFLNQSISSHLNLYSSRNYT